MFLPSKFALMVRFGPGLNLSELVSSWEAGRRSEAVALVLLALLALDSVASGLQNGL